MIVYRARCPEGLIYIGITRKTLESRRRQHERACVSGSTRKFHEALRRYGYLMVWDVIDFDTDWDRLKEKERRYIAEFNSMECGYNSTLGGEGGIVCKETRIENDRPVSVFSASNAGRNVKSQPVIPVDLKRSAPDSEMKQSSDHRMDRHWKRKQYRKLPKEEKKRIREARKRA